MNGNYLLPILALLPMAAAVISFLIGRKSKTARDYFADAACVVELALIACVIYLVATGSTLEFRLANVVGMDLYMAADGFRAIYAGIAIVMWMMTTIFSREYLHHYRNRNRYYFFGLLTFGATVGVFLSGSLYTTFVFFEIMSLASYVMVVQDEKPAAMKNGATYLTVGVLGGMVMLMGLFLLHAQLGTLEFSGMASAMEAHGVDGWIWAAAICLLVGFGAKAGCFPMHFWLPKTHPVAPAPASALLSGILTKCGVFGILVTGVYIMQECEQWGYLILCLGAVTMLLGAVLAVFSVDLKRILACSSLSQIGFILTGTGMMTLLGEENALAVRGTMLHMVNHSTFKLILFMVAGVVYMNLHKLNLNDVRGFGRKKPLLQVIYLMGMLGIAGVPGWSGYVSKTLIHESLVEFIHTFPVQSNEVLLIEVIEAVFIFSGGLTLAYMLKIYIALFWEKNVHSQEKMDSLNGKYMNGQSIFALIVPAILVPVMGFMPYLTMNKIADLGSVFLHAGELEESVNYFSMESLKGGAASLCIGVIVYLLVIRVCLTVKDAEGNTVYADLWPKWLDLEEKVYRPILMVLLPAIGAFASRVLDKLVDTIIFVLKKTVYREAPHNQNYKLFGFMRYNSRETSIQRDLFGSFSFGLVLFTLGLSAVLIYLLLI